MKYRIRDWVIDNVPPILFYTAAAITYRLTVGEWTLLTLLAFAVIFVAMTAAVRWTVAAERWNEHDR